jgi:5-methylcytosine-specific restriction enzyme subunit McrC
MSDGNVIALLDAKYRDVWDDTLPHHMLYQLAIYALSQNDREARSVILYPAMEVGATDQVVQFRDPVRGHVRAEVILRPAHLPTIATLVSRQADPAARRRRQMMPDNGFSETVALSTGWGRVQRAGLPEEFRAARLAVGASA